MGLGATRVLWHNLHSTEGVYYLQAMGYPSSFGFGLAEALPHRRVVVVDGDGSVYMNLGILATIGVYRPKNLLLIVMDNEMYEITGRTPNPASRNSSLEGIARSCGIGQAYSIGKLSEFSERLSEASKRSGPFFIDAKIEAETISLPGPTIDGKENKYSFARYIEETEGIHIFRAPGDPAS